MLLDALSSGALGPSTEWAETVKMQLIMPYSPPLSLNLVDVTTFSMNAAVSIWSSLHQNSQFELT